MYKITIFCRDCKWHGELAEAINHCCCQEEQINCWGRMHRFKRDHCGGTCLDCGWGGCLCLQIHCCCPQPQTMCSQKHFILSHDNLRQVNGKFTQNTEPHHHINSHK
jgi:hypothetical protein